MNNKPALSIEKYQKNAVNFILAVASLITLYFNSKLADPFNAPKMYILIFFALAIIPILFLTNTQRLDKVTIGASFFFILALFWAFINSPSKYTALFGETQRQLGLLTYLGFLLFFLFIVKFTSLKLIKNLQVTALLLSFIYIVYGLVQFSGNDFIKWINQYNPIIGTLGNPNYAAAFMAILFVICFSSIFDFNFMKKIKIVYGVHSIGLLLVIYLSNAKQGLISLVAGATCFTVIMIYFRSKKLGLFAVLISLIGAAFVIAGMLQSGPFSGFLYKESVSLRGYYWRAGIKMFDENFFTGVGLDNYGSFFRATRDEKFPINHGYELLSTNAHNVPIQMFATGGFFLGLSYMIISAWTLYCGIRGLRISNSNFRIKIALLVSAWVAFQSQSIVSIDNIGLTIWGWIISAFIIGSSNNLSIKKSDLSKDSTSYNLSGNIQSVSQILSIGLAMVGIVFISFLSKSEVNIVHMRNEYNSESQRGTITAIEYAQKIAADNLSQPIYKIQAADLFFNFGQSQKATSIVRDVVNDSPNNPTYQWALANILEANKQFLQAIKIRSELSKSDPQNINNYLQLTRLYIETKNITLAEKSAQEIARLNISSEQNQIAIQELANYRKSGNNE